MKGRLTPSEPNYNQHFSYCHNPNMLSMSPDARLKLTDEILDSISEDALELLLEKKRRASAKVIATEHASGTSAPVS